MLKDPWLEWVSGPFPYDALSGGKITPESSMSQIKDVPFDLIELGQWDMQARLAWEQLRIAERRLWIDFLLYPLALDGILAALEGLTEDQPQETTTTTAVAHFLGSELSDLQRLIEELKSKDEIQADPTD
jgi:hypothetical protein